MHPRRRVPQRIASGLDQERCMQSTETNAQIARELVTSTSPTGERAHHGAFPCRGAYHYAAGATPKTALIATHYDADFSEHYLAAFMAEHGYGFLGWNTRYAGQGHRFILEHALVDISVGVRWLRDRGVERVVLLGNSGGASLMSAYQSQAVEPNLAATPWGDLPEAAGNLDPADALVVLCAHPGRPDVLTAWLDPSVTDESDPLSRDPALDMFDEAHGPPYPAAFVERYRAAQRRRNDRITEWVFREHDRLVASGANDRVFPVFRTWADLRFLDLDLDRSERRVGCYIGDARTANYLGQGLADVCTLRSWLSMWSLSVSQCRAAPHLARIRQPAIVIDASEDRGCYPSDAAHIYDALASDDKARTTVAADHYLRRPADARTEVSGLIAEWLTRHGW
jgi:hypothetical protein